MFSKILIANRGEIALRILRACKEMGISTVAVHSTADSDAMHVKLADESVCIGPSLSCDSYLNIPAIISAAEVSGAEAIHPGVGFLSENSYFANVVRDHKMVFIGPSSEHMDVMGNKVSAREKAIELGFDVISGSLGIVSSEKDAAGIAKEIGFPVLIKARSGGGGKGMRVVRSLDELKENFEIAKSEAEASFGDDGVYIERFLSKPRHIELQMLGDTHGNMVCLGDRDCSLQKKHQKVFEESPSPALSRDEREYIFEKAISAMKDFGYYSAGTLEFLYEDGKFYFIEMNTRIQVEHPITEMITGIDIVKEQIRIASGGKLGFSQKDVRFRGHAMECRINAEDPMTFLPQPGKIIDYLAPGGPNVRVDSFIFSGYTIPPYYDSLIAKLITYGNTREECLMTMKRALDEYVITGVKTLIPLHQRLALNEGIVSGSYDTNWLDGFIFSLQCPPECSSHWCSLNKAI
ncbi:acetyl-CoA carboxylase biotin carboxylase subunit [Candidatus Hydrogenosomobacter endosymbioticus]|nr:acetyl-CoA carboxylase biotin carboxylase subunit [Candidatus Hydrogenosomobacter endosymbioticus]